MVNLVDGWMANWVDEWMHGWMDGQLGRLMVSYLDR